MLSRVSSKTVRVQRTIEMIALPTFMIGIWQAGVDSAWFPEPLVSRPLVVIQSWYYLTISGVLWEHALASLSRLGAGYALGSLAGIFLGSLAAMFGVWERLLCPTIKILAPTPPIAWVPLYIILFGIEEASKIALIFSACAIVAFMNTFEGIRAVDQSLVELGKLHQKSRWETYRHILLPGASRQILVGLRLGLGFAWILVVAAELIASTQGLGWFIWDARNFSRPDEMLAGILTLGSLGFLTDTSLTALESPLLSWEDNYAGE